MIKNLDQINHIKRDKVRKGLEYIASVDDEHIIKKVIIFGSAATPRCTDDSDIDICLVSDKPTKDPLFFRIFGELPIAMDDVCDVVPWSLVSSDFQNEIMKKGVSVYEP